MKHLRDDVSMVLLNSNKIEEIAKKYAHYKDLFFLWRNKFALSHGYGMKFEM